MRTLVNFALTIGAATISLIGCGGSQSSVLAPGSITKALGAEPRPLPPESLFMRARWDGQGHPDRHKSWISPDAKKAARLYFASDVDTDDVYIFKLPGMSLIGTITGFGFPAGLCADSHGNVFVTDSSKEQVFEYSHGGELRNTYNTGLYGEPNGCAIDPATGDLAVAELQGTTKGSMGNVLVYVSPKSLPAVLSNPGQYLYYFAGYGPGGSLWVDGFTYDLSFILSKCSASNCSTITLSGGTIYFPGNVQWDDSRNEWVIFDGNCNDTGGACSYPVTASGVLGAPTDYTNYLGAPVCSMVQWSIAKGGNYVVGGDGEQQIGCHSGANPTFDRWGYDGGGNPTKYTTAGYAFPWGAAISTK